KVVTSPHCKLLFDNRRRARVTVFPLPLHHTNNNNEEEEELPLFWLRALQRKKEMDELERALEEARDSKRACRVMIGGGRHSHSIKGKKFEIESDVEIVGESEDGFFIFSHLHFF